MAITQGSPLPNITSTETQVDTPPGYYTNYLTSLSQAGQNATARTGLSGIAAYDPLQDLGYTKFEDAAKSYKSGLTDAKATLDRAAKGVTADRAKALLSPYTSNVVNEMERLQQQSLQRSVLPTLKAGFVGTGGLGGQRYAGALGQAMSDAQRNLLGQQAAALESGYTEALRAALGELPYLTQAGQQQAQVAKMEQDLGLIGAGALTKAGAERQAYQQSLLDYPLKTAVSASGLLRGYQVPIDRVATRVGPGQAGQYQKSDLDNILGVLSLIGSAYGGTTGAGGNALGVGLNKVFGVGSDLLKQLFGESPSANVQEIPNYSRPGDTSGAYGWRYFTDGTAISPLGEYYYEGQLVWSPPPDDTPPI
jgi:hypothetical protein